MSPGFLESTRLSERALQFLLNLHDAGACQEESIGTLCLLAEERQPGAVGHRGQAEKGY